MKAIVIKEWGGPEVLRLEDVPIPEPKLDEALVKIEAIGVNFIDVYHRTGLYPMKLPATPGSEAAGIVEAVGTSVSEVKVGDRVAYAMSIGSYAEYAAVPAWKLVQRPEGISALEGAAAMLQGMTAHYLTMSTYPLKPGETAVVHAAAGGVGLLLTQLAKRIGVRVIGTVSTDVKADLAREAGADEVIVYAKQDFEEEVRHLTKGNGVQVVYDAVGKDTFQKSLNCLAPRGMLVLYGQSSGAVPAVDPLLLSKGGSLFLTRPALAHYTATREELLWRAEDVLKGVAAGQLKLKIQKTFPLQDAAEAHRQLEGRKTTGKVLLIP